MRIITALAVAIVLSAGASFAGQRVGWVSDEKCANAGKAASADHAECARTCVKGGEAIVFLDEQSGHVVKVKNPDKVKDFVGKKVTINGMLVGPGVVEIQSVTE